MEKLLLKTFLLAVILSPVLALVGIVFDLSETRRELLAGGAAVYIFIAYYFPRAERIWREERRKEENEYMDRFLAEREQREGE